MKLFKISGKFQQNGEWSDLKADFIGYFIKREGSNVIEGYVDEQFITKYDRTRYIKGLYIEEANQLVFLKMCNDSILQPLAYDFPNLNNHGFWSGFDYNAGFFPNGKSEGHATITLEEITCKSEKQKMAQSVIAVYNRKTSQASCLNQCLMDDVESLKDFLDESSAWFPKE